MPSQEDILQIACSNYLKLQYPKALFCHVPNGGNRSAVTGAVLKRMGTKKGVPDLLIFDRRGEYAGLAIELKVTYKRVNKNGTIKLTDNKPSPEQEEWLERLYYNGWRTHVIYSFESFKALVDEYFEYTEKHIIPDMKLNLN